MSLHISSLFFSTLYFHQSTADSPNFPIPSVSHKLLLALQHYCLSQANISFCPLKSQQSIPQDKVLTSQQPRYCMT